MKKLNLKNVFTALILIIFTITLACCGGGAAGGAGGASLPDSEYTTHNPGGWGGGGSSGGGSSGANSGETNVSVQGSTPLVVTGYSYGGQTYTSVEALTQAMTAGGATGTFTVPFTVAGGETRQARVTSTAEGFSLEHQYKATCVISTLANGDESTPVMYYANDGVNVTALNASNTAIIGWSANGTTHTENPVMGLQGDITLNAVFDLPACKINVNPGTATETGTNSDIYEITSLTDTFTFTVAMADDTSFTPGTSVTAWLANGTSVGTPAIAKAISPSDAGITDSSIGSNAGTATEFSVTCTLTIPGAPQAVTVNKVIRVFKKITLPGFSITVTEPSSAAEAGTYGNPSGTRYAVTSLTDTFTLTAGSNVTFPTGTVFNWTISAGGTPVTRTGQTVTVAPSDLGTISTVSTSPTEWLISCTASHADGANTPNTNKRVYLYKENPLKMNLSQETGISWVTDSTYKITNMNVRFLFSVTEENGSNISDATGYQWKVNGNTASGQTSSTFQPTTNTLCNIAGITTIGTNQTNATEIEVKCLVTRASGSSVPVVKTIKVFQPVTLPTFSISVTKPNSATESATDKYSVTSLTDTFSLTAGSGVTFPDETTFNWTITGSSGPIQKTGRTITVGPTEPVSTLSTSYNSPTSWSITCVADHNDAAADVTATKTIYLYKLPAGKVNVDPSTVGTAYANGLYELTTLTNNIKFEAGYEGGSVFPDGTIFAWTVNGSSVSGQTGDVLTIAPSALDLYESTIGSSNANATPVTVGFVATRPDGTMTGTTEFKFFMQPTLPTSFDVTITPPDTAGTTTPYTVYTNTDEFTFTAGGASFPTGTKFNWEITGGSLTVERTNQTTTSVSIPASAFGTISTDSGNPTPLTAECTIANTAASNSPQSAEETVAVYKFTIPAFTITFTPADGSYDATQSDTTGTVPLYAMTNTTSSFEVQAVPTSGSFPAGTKFSWTVAGFSCNGPGQDGDTLSGLTFGGFGLSPLSTSSATPTSFSIACTAHDDHNPALVTKNADSKTVKVYEYVPVVTMKTGNDINTALRALGANSGSDKTFSASATPPAEGATVQLLSDTGSPVEVVAWADGANIKYYAAGYTDAGVKIPLNADCAYMFDGCSKLINIDLSGFDTSSATNMRYMFNSCQGMTSINLSYFDISNVTNIMGMFYSCSHLETIYVSTSVSTSFATTSAVGDNMFNNCYALKGGGSPQTTYSLSHTNKEYARIDDPANGLPGYFTLAP